MTKYSTSKQTEQAAYDQVTNKPFTKIHGRPTRTDRNYLRDEVCAAASDRDTPFAEAGDFRLLGEIMEADEYTALTSLVYAEPEEPEAYDEDITKEMDDHT